MACGTRSDSRSGPARASSGSATSAGSRGRRSTGSRTRRRGRAELRLAVHRGDAPPPGELRPGPEPLLRASTPPAARPRPYFSYLHGQNVAGETCPTGHGSSISGLAFYTGGAYPAQFQGSLFFSDYSRQCIWVMYAGGNGLPDPANVQPFINDAAGPVQLQTGPDGDLFYVDFNGGRLHRIVYAGRQPRADGGDRGHPTSGPAPLTVSFSGTGSTRSRRRHPDLRLGPRRRRRLRRLDRGRAGFTYTSPASVPVGLRVTDPGALSDTDSVTITATGTRHRAVRQRPALHQRDQRLGPGRARPHQR